MERITIAEMLLDRVDDQHLGLRTREQEWTWDEVVRESAACGELARSLRVEGPFHIGVLLENVAEFLFWLGGAALAGGTIVGINPTRGSAELETEIRHVDCQLIVTDSAGMDKLKGLDLGLSTDRFVLVDAPGYQKRIDAHRVEPAMAGGVDEFSLFLLLFTSGTTGMSKGVKCSQGRLSRLAYANTSNKILKRELQGELWRTDDPVYRWEGRGEPTYTQLTADAKATLEAEFVASGRQRFLGV